MTVGRFLTECSTDELIYWQAVARLEDKQRKTEELRARAAAGISDIKRQLKHG